MDVTLSVDLTQRMRQELAAGHYPSETAIIEQALRHLFDDRQRGTERVEALRRIAKAVDNAGLYERTLLPDR